MNDLTSLSRIQVNYEFYMENSLKKYGVKIVPRPKIKPSKELDLTGKEGEKIVEYETKLILIRHRKAFERLADL